MNAQHPVTGRTALHEAALRGASGAVANLVAHGADVNCRDKGGMTALELAAYEDEGEDEGGEEGGRAGDSGGKADKLGGKSGRESGGQSGRDSGDRSDSAAAGRAEVQCVLIGLGAELGTQAQAERVAWRASFLGADGVLRALAEHPQPGQACAGLQGRHVLCAQPRRPSEEEEAEAARGGTPGPPKGAPGAGACFHTSLALFQ